MKPGTYAVQLYFQTLDLETGMDSLTVSLQQPIANETLHVATGRYVNGPGGMGFWGPMMSVHARELPASHTAPNGTLDFTMNVGPYPNTRSFTITKYRLWYVSSGDLGTKSVSENPRNGLPTYTNNNGLVTSSSGPYYATLNWASSAFQINQAAMVRVCFENFDVEAGYDYVEIEDKLGQVVEILTGTLGNLCSAWVQGDQVKVKLYTDYSVVRYGFDIVRIEAKKGTQVFARYPGQWYEPETEVRHPTSNVVQYSGLHYNWHRYYDPNTGRYITPNPLGLEAGMNLYAYAGNDPVHNIDPNGLDVIYWWWPKTRYLWGRIPPREKPLPPIPHAGLQVWRHSLQKKFASGKSLPILYFDFYPYAGKNGSSDEPNVTIDKRSWARGAVGNTPSEGYAYGYRIKTTTQQDLCVIRKSLERDNVCLKGNVANKYVGCRYNLHTYDCRNYAHEILMTCGIWKWPRGHGKYSYPFSSAKHDYYFDWKIGVKHATFLDFAKAKKVLGMPTLKHLE